MEDETPYNVNATITDVPANTTVPPFYLDGHRSENDFYAFHRPLFGYVDRYVTCIWYVIGLSGNTLAFLVWIRKRMRHSSGCYLSALALADLIFLLLHICFELEQTWNLKVISVPIYCEIYPILSMTFQYTSPLFVLGFTVERYISVCHPFKREQYCTIKKAVVVIVALMATCLALSAVQGYFWQYNYVKKECYPRAEVVAGGTYSPWSIWSWITEMTIFGFVPIMVLFFNILVICEARKMRKLEITLGAKKSKKSASTTFMLLVVSFYLIITTLPATIMYVLYFYFPYGDTNMNDEQIKLDETWQRHLDYKTIGQIVYEICMSHYACNFFIYVATGKLFRRELKFIIYQYICRKDWRQLRGKEFTESCGSPGTMKTTVDHNTRLLNGNNNAHTVL
ncbi:unnamed protein product [Owenia fusiformis]|uniref:Uncharacterized protein n=1 Tax=Owenia fusiformis TaxID=6347 RepID=A0A8J1TXY2_OWEFU|nr:unnamed protein product [Owenia fusiformis]